VFRIIDIIYGINLIKLTNNKVMFKDSRILSKRQ